MQHVFRIKNVYSFTCSHSAVTPARGTGARGSRLAGARRDHEGRADTPDAGRTATGFVSTVSKNYVRFKW